MPRTRTFATILLTLWLAGCTSGEHLPPWLGACKIQGIDVSRHQGDIDWPAVADAGIKFVWMKATEGGDHVDAEFRRNWTLAAAAGVKRGAYHFVYWCRPAREQAAWFVANVPDDPDALPPVLDVEWNPSSRTCPQKVAREKAVADIKIMLDLIERTYGRRPIIYAPSDIFAEIIEGGFEAYPLWVRSIGTAPDQYGARNWLVWQYSATGTVPGVRNKVDRDCTASFPFGHQNTAEIRHPRQMAPVRSADLRPSRGALYGLRNTEAGQIAPPGKGQ